MRRYLVLQGWVHRDGGRHHAHVGAVLSLDPAAGSTTYMLEHGALEDVDELDAATLEARRRSVRDAWRDPPRTTVPSDRSQSIRRAINNNH